MSKDDATDFTPYLTEIFNDLMNELRSRFPKMDDFSEQDQVAVASAVGKAVWRGFLSGVAAHATEVNERVPQVNLQTWIHRPEGDNGEPDPWADQYGDSSGDDA